MQLKRKFLFWMTILLLTVIPIILDTVADKHGKHYPFIWSIFILPSILIMAMYPTWTAIIGSGIIYSFLKYTIEFNQQTVFSDMDILALFASSFINLSIHLTLGYFRIRYDKLLQKVKQLSLTDSLTGLYNRRYFDLYIEKALLSKRTNNPLLLIFLDIDHFKSVNDTNGHQCGDHALKHIADIIKRNVRELDTIMRIGGEEFAVFLPDTGLEEGKNIADRIRVNVEKTEFIYKYKHIPLTISLGLAQYHGENFKVFIEKTDKALYQAKKNGRNQLVVA